MFKKITTAERVSDKDLTDNYVFKRSLFAYKYAANIVSGKVLEIGTGTGYGIDLISQNTSEFITIDKKQIPIELAMSNDKVKFLKMKAPQLDGIPTGYLDFGFTMNILTSKLRNLPYYFLFMRYTFLFLLLFLPLLSYSQTDVERKQITLNYDQVKLKELSQHFSDDFYANYNKAIKLAKLNGWPLKSVCKDGNLSYLIGVHDSGKPIYISGANAGAGITSRTNTLYPGGGLD